MGKNKNLLAKNKNRGGVKNVPMKQTAKPKNQAIAKNKQDQVNNSFKSNSPNRNKQVIKNGKTNKKSTNKFSAQKKEKSDSDEDKSEDMDDFDVNDSGDSSFDEEKMKKELTANLAKYGSSKRTNEESDEDDDSEAIDFDLDDDEDDDEDDSGDDLEDDDDDEDDQEESDQKEKEDEEEVKVASSRKRKASDSADQIEKVEVKGEQKKTKLSEEKKEDGLTPKQRKKLKQIEKKKVAKELKMSQNKQKEDKVKAAEAEKFLSSFKSKLTFEKNSKEIVQENIRRLNDLSKRSIHLAPIHKKCTFEQLKQLSPSVLSVYLPTYRKGHCKGTAFLEYASPEAADKAAVNLKTKTLADKKLEVSQFGRADSKFKWTKPEKFITFDKLVKTVLLVKGVPSKCSKKDILVKFPRATECKFYTQTNGQCVGQVSLVYNDENAALFDFERSGVEKITLPSADPKSKGLCVVFKLTGNK